MSRTFSKSTRGRTVLTTEQQNDLESVFVLDINPSNQIRSKIARELNLSEDTVRIWFQNRRRKARTLGTLPSVHVSAKKLLDYSNEISPSSESTLYQDIYRPYHDQPQFKVYTHNKYNTQYVYITSYRSKCSYYQCCDRHYNNLLSPEILELADLPLDSSSELMASPIMPSDSYFY